MRRRYVKTLAIIPVTAFILTCVVFVIEILVFYHKPFYGKGENPQNLKIETYLAGDNQPTHPSVLDFGKEWNGWRYWMAYSPYPYGNGEEENPCIAVSNDMNLWRVPNGLYNPIAFNEETGCDELKDPHIVYNNHTDSLEMWYLGRINGTIASGSDLLLMRKKSINGVEWSQYEVLDTVNGTLSPSIIYEDGIYRRWFIKPSTEKASGKLLYAESKDAKNWTDDKECILDKSSAIQKIWHGAVAICRSEYCFVFIESSHNGDKIMYTTSRDGIHYSKASCIISKGTLRHHFYRPCILVSNDSIYCLYGTVDHDNTWKIAMSVCARESFPRLKYIHSNDLKEFRVYLTGALKRILRAIHIPMLAILSIVLSVIICFIPCLSKFWLVWSITWILLILSGGILDFVGTFKLCIYILVTGIISLFSSFVSFGIRILMK